MKEETKQLTRRFLFLVILAVFFMSMVMVISPNTAAAHAPSKVTLAYDKATKTLTVTITHKVFWYSFLKSHYIKTVTVMSNGIVIQTTTYDSQPTADTFTYTYTVDAITGTKLSARADCSYSGSDTGIITVP
ncbi:MAG: hypothetical protein ABSB79_04280 [Syntrophales bacterium]